MDSTLSPVQSSGTTLSGRVVDSLSKKGLSGAKIVLKGSEEAVTYSGENGLFSFNQTTTGAKELDVAVSGYKSITKAVDLKINPNSADTLYLLRENHLPGIRKVFPAASQRQNLPLMLKFNWSFWDDDLQCFGSKEALKYRFYFGTSRNPVLVDSGILDTPYSKRDTSIMSHRAWLAHKPDIFYNDLSASTWYYFRIVVLDLLNDSAVLGLDSFRTRANFHSVCTLDMKQVEYDSAAFCMDTVEFSNEMLFSAYPGYKDSVTPYSPGDLMPAVKISKKEADSACRYYGKRLCKISEWQAALKGYDNYEYPYGDAYNPQTCNTAQAIDSTRFERPAVVISGTLWDCISSYGIYDLSGNVAEWVENDLSDIPNSLYPYVRIVFSEPWVYSYQAGGSWFNGENSGINSIEKFLPECKDCPIKAIDVGFRCCKDLVK